MPFNPNLDQTISLTEASNYTANFRQANPGAVTANAYNKTQMKNLLEQDNCEGFRIYNGIDENGAQQLVIVAIDINGNDLYEGMLMDRAQPCPENCSSKNPLNSND